MSSLSTHHVIVATAGILALLSVSPAWGQSDGHYVIFEGLADGRSSAYTLEATGSIEMARGSLAGVAVSHNSEVDVGGRTVEGVVWRGADGFRIQGDIRKITLEQPENVQLHIGPLSRAGSAAHRSGGSPPSRHYLVIEGLADGRSSAYALEATESIEMERGSLAGVPVSYNAETDVGGRTVEGVVWRGADGFRINGGIEALTIDQPGRVHILAGNPLGEAGDAGTPDEAVAGETETRRQALVGGVVYEGCSAPMSENLAGAVNLLVTQLTGDYPDFEDCLDRAYLVEHQGHGASTIAREFTAREITTIGCAELGEDTLGQAPVDQRQAEARLRIDERRMEGLLRFDPQEQTLEIDEDLALSAPESQIAGTIAHELGHNYGYEHAANDFGTAYYPNTVPEQVEACVETGNPNPWPGPGSATITPSDVIASAVDGENDFVFTFYRDGTVTAGTSEELHSRRVPDRFTPPAGESVSDIVGMAIDGENDFVFAWYDDGTVSAGTTDALDSRRSRRSFSLPRGYGPSDIVDVAIDGENDLVFAFYTDGRVSAGSTEDLDSERAPYRYVVPSGKSPANIIGVGIDGFNDFVFAWYDDMTVSAGRTDDLFSRRSPRPFDTGR